MIPTFLLLVAPDAVDMTISSGPIYDEVGIRKSVGFSVTTASDATGDDNVGIIITTMAS